ncbi:MAG TPA: hypothetical protein VL326_13375 [Kofleriaceae bacterium]|nr:hypothetical protein [Kofleriaceae bacterium]
MSTRSEVLLWAQRVIARKASPAHEILELRPDAGPEQAQEAFHKIARTAHPDLHRKGLTPEELEMVTSAYAISAGAYQTMRMQTMQTTRMKPVVTATPPAGAPVVPRTTTPTRVTPQPAGRPTPVPTAPAASVPATPAGPVPAANATQSMSSKALVYYRKAELSLKRGDLKGAVLQLKLAIAADPASGFLRTALAEVELEVRKGT